MTDPRPRRRGLAIGLVALASVMAYVAILAIWVDRQLLNTDNWTAASSQMLENPTIRGRLGEYMVEEMYANVDVEAELRAALPKRAQSLAGPAAGALRNFAERAANEVLSRPRAQQAWEDANRASHERLLQVLEGGGPIVSTTGGAVAIDVKALLALLEERVGIGGRLAERLPADAATVEVLRSDELELAQDAFQVLDALPVVSVVLSLALFGTAIAVAPAWRRQAVRGFGFGLVAAGAAAFATASLGGDAIVNSLVATEAGEPAAREVWTIVTQLLVQAAGATIGYGLALVLGAWLAGPTRLATAIRRVSAPYLREPAIAFGAFAVVAAAVMLWWEPTPATRNPVTAIMLVILYGIGFEALRRKTVQEFPDADRHEQERRVRARMAQTYHSLRERLSDGGRATVRRASADGDEVAGSGTSAQPADTRVDQLERLARLHETGALDDQEFRAAKSRILGDSTSVAL
jgi:membrane protein required for beta-lactamase induction